MASGDALKAAFAKFADKGNGKEMTSKAATKWATDAGILSKKGSCSSNNLDIVFTKVKPKGKNTITANELDAFCTELAKTYGKDKKISDAEEAKKQLIEKLSEASPVAHGATKVSKVGGVDRMTDTSKYTGSHKERFDADGKGKGIKGREDIADNSGYVGNYQGEGTYDKK